MAMIRTRSERNPKRYAAEGRRIRKNASALLYVLILAPLLLSAGCGGGPGGSGLPDDFGGKHWPTGYGDAADDGRAEIAGWSSGGKTFYVLAEQEVYGPDSEISMALFNIGEENAYYGVDYGIEMKTGSSWSRVPFGRTVAIDAIGLGVPPGGVGRQQVQLEDFPPGIYRYVKSVEFEKSGETKTVYGGFTVKQDGE
ncbi:hypothetical protein GYN08_13540 [Saccharibacillus sp. VR-M41]|uniref:Bacterial Ig-like domain-containing protein n=2 Tax=Saccharibacillus alkalitolerans TaxID=2705290 RepID=A0ABX0F7R3_9BACL|nr:hypothetical protein [Saccharibacillus alkalitolerans]